MKRIESKADFIAWATEINNGISLARKCDLQDVYAHSNREDLDRFFIEAEGERKLIICSVNNVMAFEEVEHLLNVLARHKCSKQIELEYKEIDRRESALAARERAQQESRKSYHKRLAEQRRQIETLQQKERTLTARLDEVKKERDAFKLEALQNEIDGVKFRTIRDLLQPL